MKLYIYLIYLIVNQIFFLITVIYNFLSVEFNCYIFRLFSPFLLIMIINDNSLLLLFYFSELKLYLLLYYIVVASFLVDIYCGMITLKIDI